MMPKTSSVIVPKDNPKPKLTEAEQAELRRAYELPRAENMVVNRNDAGQSGRVRKFLERFWRAGKDLNP
jgi:hypothetical protein